jgi:hypothetical protein
MKNHLLKKTYIMRNLIVISILGFLPVLFFSSCENEDKISFNNEFKIEFNNGKTITEQDILFYDRSTHLIYLKRDMDLNKNATDFYVSIAGDTIYQGIINSCNLSSMPPSPYFIQDCFHYGYDILEIGFNGASVDLRNAPDILNAFEKSHLLRNGISCKIDKVEIQSFESFSKVICTITIHNNDNINYYILDPEKMGDLDFNYFTGGLTLQNMSSKHTYPLRWSVESGTWSEVDLEDLSLLKKGSEVTYTFQSSDYGLMEPGEFSASFRFCGTKQSPQNINLNQKNGRIWVGQMLTEISNLTVVF